MKNSRFQTIGLTLACVVMLASCGAFKNATVGEEKVDPTGRRSGAAEGQSVLDNLRGDRSEVKVNRFLWTASLEVLNFLPIQTADPFTGVISTGFGRPPGGGQAYRATVLVSDPALDARSLKVALQTQRGPVSADTQRAVEDAILARARQLRINAARF